MTRKRFRKIIQRLLLIFFILMKKCPAYISKHNPTCEKQRILFMIPNEEKE